MLKCQFYTSSNESKTSNLKMEFTLPNTHTHTFRNKHTHIYTIKDYWNERVSFPHGWMKAKQWEYGTHTHTHFDKCTHSYIRICIYLYSYMIMYCQNVRQFYKWSNKCKKRKLNEWVIRRLPLSLSLSHTHTHTHTHIYIYTLGKTVVIESNGIGDLSPSFRLSWLLYKNTKAMIYSLDGETVFFDTVAGICKKIH